MPQNERDALVLIDRRLSSLMNVINYHARHCNPEGVTITILNEIRAATMAAWDAVPCHLAVKREWTMTPQQEHAITETALRTRKAEKEYYARRLYGDVYQVRQEMLEARADLYALLDGALARLAVCRAKIAWFVVWKPRRE